MNVKINHIKNTVSKKENMLSLVTCIIFCICIGTVGFISFVKKPKSYSNIERRYLEQLPKLTKESIIDGSFALNYERYITDQFIFRDSFIQIKTIADRAIGKQEAKGVYFGKDGYLIEKMEVNDDRINQFHKNKEWITQFLLKTSEQLGEDHVRAMLVPTAEYILQDKLPPYATAFDQELLMNELYDAIERNASMTLAKKLLVNVNATLQSKTNEYIYYRSDHHWTTLGAYYAFCDYVKSIGGQVLPLDSFKRVVIDKDFLGTIYNKVHVSMKPDWITLYQDSNSYQLDINMGEKKIDSLYDYEQLNGFDKYSVFLGGNNAMVQIKSSNKNNKRLLVIKDSYAHSFVPFVASQYESIVLVDLRYLNSRMQDIIKQFQITDVLLLYNNSTVMSDRNLVKLAQ